MLESIIVTFFFIIMLFKAVNSKNHADNGQEEIESIAVFESRLLCVFINGIIIMGVMRLDKSIILSIIGFIAAIILFIIARKDIVGFFSKNQWCKSYFYVYLGFTLFWISIYSGISSISPIILIRVNLWMRGVLALIAIMLARISLPANAGFIIFRSFIYQITYGDSK
ncbi:MAG: hypothetical protein Q4F05_08255 [bacterium]|nr:hypothetical protein [bacterium]